MEDEESVQNVVRLECLEVRRYRALGDVSLRGLTPLTVLLGPNGSGKSTVLDVLTFLWESFSSDLRSAWEKRGRLKELRTRGEHGPIEIGLSYRECSSLPLKKYHLAIDETSRGPIVLEEWLAELSPTGEPRRRLLEFHKGTGRAFLRSGDRQDGSWIDESLESTEKFAAGILGQLAKYPEVVALRQLLTNWSLFLLNADRMKGIAAGGVQEHLSGNGDNLANVLQYLKQRHPGALARIFEVLAQRVPRLESVSVESLPDKNLLLQVKDVPFEQPITARFVSDGTLKFLSYLTILHDPDPVPLAGFEEPENFLFPMLLPELAEECREAAVRMRLLVSTHSPLFVNSLHPEELWLLKRDERGHTQAKRATEIGGVPEFLREGAVLGDLWLEGFLEDSPSRRSGPAVNASLR